MKPGWGVRVRREEDTAWQGTREMVKPLLTGVMLRWPGDRREQNTAPFPSAALASAHLGPRCTETFGTSLPNTYYVLALGWNADDEDTVLTPQDTGDTALEKKSLTGRLLPGLLLGWTESQ